MFTRRGRRLSIARSRRLAHARTRGANHDMMETLEQRIVLSADTGDLGVFVDPSQAYTPAQLAELAGAGPFVEDAIAPIEWGGGFVEAPIGSFVATFDDQFDIEQITSTLQAAGDLAGFEAANVVSIGRGQWAQMCIRDSLTFIDADKERIPEYFEHAVRLSRPGGVVIVDNVIRDGKIADPANTEPSVLGVRRLLDRLATDHRVDATAVQTVGEKGYDGYLMAVVDGVSPDA